MFFKKRFVRVFFVLFYSRIKQLNNLAKNYLGRLDEAAITLPNKLTSVK